MLPTLRDRCTGNAGCVLLRLNSVEVEIRGLRPEVVAEDDKVLVYSRSRTNVRRRLSAKIFT